MPSDIIRDRTPIDKLRERLPQHCRPEAPISFICENGREVAVIMGINKYNALANGKENAHAAQT